MVGSPERGPGGPREPASRRKGWALAAPSALCAPSAAGAERRRLRDLRHGATAPFIERRRESASPGIRHARKGTNHEHFGLLAHRSAVRRAGAPRGSPATKQPRSRSRSVAQPSRGAAPVPTRDGDDSRRGWEQARRRERCAAWRRHLRNAPFRGRVAENHRKAPPADLRTGGATGRRTGDAEITRRVMMRECCVAKLWCSKY